MVSKTVERIDKTQLILCACGCGQTLLKYKLHHGQWRERKYIVNHYWRGRKRNTATKGEKHHNWKGEAVGYVGLHMWLRRNLTKPDLCQQCKLKLPLDMANKTGIYDRNPENWLWLCKKCHNHLDHIYQRNLKSFRIK